MKYYGRSIETKGEDKEEAELAEYPLKSLAQRGHSVTAATMREISRDTSVMKEAQARCR